LGLDYIHPFALSEIQHFRFISIHPLSLVHIHIACTLDVTVTPSTLSGALSWQSDSSPIIRTRVRLSCPSLTLLHITVFSGSLRTYTRTYNQPGFIRSFQRVISCQRYHRCIDKVLHVKLKLLWRIYDTSLLKRADNEDHISLSQSFHDTVAHSAYANVLVMTFSGMTEQFLG
jgi:hypothetical protein